MRTLRDQLKNMYAEYDRFILPVVKFALAMLTFLCINREIGYLEPLNNALLILVLCAICAILPWNAIPVIGVGMIILNCFGVGMETGACAAALYLILLIFYFRFVPGDGLALTLTAASCSFGLPGLVPVSLGLMRGPVSAFTAVCSMISWFFIKTVQDVAVPMKASPDYSTLDVVNGILEGMVNNKELLAYVITFAAVVLFVSLIRSSGFSWSWEIAIAAGAAIQILLLFLLGSILAIEVDMASMLLGTLIAAAVSVLLMYFVYDVDYRGAERYQFEDDEYVYYVKAIPKKVSVQKTSEAEDVWEEDE